MGATSDHTGFCAETEVLLFPCLCLPTPCITSQGMKHMWGAQKKAGLGFQGPAYPQRHSLQSMWSILSEGPESSSNLFRVAKLLFANLHAPVVDQSPSTDTAV